MKVAFVFAKGRLARQASVSTADSAKDFFYGAIEFGERGHEVAMFEIGATAPPSFSHSALDGLYRAQLLPSRTTAPLVLQLHALCPRLNQGDVIVATASGIAYALGLLRIFGFLRPPIVAIHCGLVNYQLTRRRRLLNGFLLRRMWTQLYGQGEFDEVRRLFRVPANRVEVNQFGVDIDFWTPGSANGDQYLLSIGNDARRDYELLFDVARRIDERFIVVTRQPLPGPPPDNVTVLSGDWHGEAITDPALRDLIRNAKCVVIPLQETLQPSGQSVCLQAMACARPVVMTRTRGLWSEDMMSEGKNILFVPPEDADAMVARLDELLGDPDRARRMGLAGRATVEEQATIEKFATRLEDLCARVAQPPNDRGAGRGRPDTMHGIN